MRNPTNAKRPRPQTNLEIAARVRSSLERRNRHHGVVGGDFKENIEREASATA